MKLHVHVHVPVPVPVPVPLPVTMHVRVYVFVCWFKTWTLNPTHVTQPWSQFQPGPDMLL